jgi:multidrug efflux pump subunit AcrA (membrane-fusion protein)
VRTDKFSFANALDRKYLEHLPCLERIVIPSPIKVIAWTLITGFLCSVLALTLIPWVQTTSGPGKVNTMNPGDRVQSINATVSGRIARWYVREGDSVRAGDPIVQIQDIDTELLSRLQAQLDAAEAKLVAAREAVETARIDYRRREQLFNEGLVSRYEYEQAMIKVQELLVKEQEATSDLNSAQVNLSRQGSQLVTAPRDGTVINVAAGDIATIVSAGTTLASFMPANVERAVEIYIDGRDIGLVTPGRQVRLEFEGWPAFQFSGVPNQAIGTFSGDVVFVEPSARPDGTFRVLLREPAGVQDCFHGQDLDFTRNTVNCAWPPESYIRLGANVRGWILLDTVPLGFELWRLLNNFPPVNTMVQEGR